MGGLLSKRVDRHHCHGLESGAERFQGTHDGKADARNLDPLLDSRLPLLSWKNLNTSRICGPDFLRLLRSPFVNMQRLTSC